tara:strand:- start:377 stop:553 length:177 start_codon:yes stop_codon:yes gene_type:complete
MSKKVNVLEIIMIEESIFNDRLGDEIASLIQHIDEQGYLLQHREGLVECIDAELLEEE